MSNSPAGKGDKPRPYDKNKWDQNYDTIFARKNISEWAKEYGDAFPGNCENKKCSRAEYEDLVLSWDASNVEQYD